MIRRGEIWWASLSAPRGSEPGYRSPVLIVQIDAFNRSRIGTVVAVVITSNVKLAGAPGNVFLPSKSAALPKDSVANISQIITLDKAFLIERVGAVPKSIFNKVENGLRLVLGL